MRGHSNDAHHFSDSNVINNPGNFHALLPLRAQPDSTALRSLDLDCDYLHGQGYDGSGSMTGRVRGTSRYITQQHPFAVYVHCFSHTLNVAIANSCTIPLVRNMMGSVSEFIHGKRQDKLDEVIESEYEDISKKKQIKPLCRTRWVERYDA